jgi:hypothetical protein
MNIIFHIATAVGLFSVVNNSPRHPLIKTGIAFFGGIILHGIIDYTPHCYPFTAKMDILISAVVIMVLLIGTTKERRLLLFICILGNVFPDLVDLGPTMVNKYLSWNLPIYDTVFPWHWKKYSGSIYDNDCVVSNYNHWTVVIGVIITVILNGFPLKKHL